MAAMMPVPEQNNHSDSPNYKQKYRTLKRKLKFLLYEQEYFQDELCRVQKKLLRVSRDKSFLLDRLLQYENVENSSSDEERTASSSGASDNEGLIKGLMEELPQPAPNPSRAKKVKLTNHGVTPEQHGMYPSSEGGTSGTGTEVETKNMVQCKYSNNDIQCQELISKRSKSGYCTAHRTVIRISKQAISGSKKQQNQFGDSRNEQSIVDEQQLQHLRELPESSTSNEVPHATELPQDVFNMEEDEKDSENEDSTGSPGFGGGNIYEGDDDLVIDLQE